MSQSAKTLAFNMLLSEEAVTQHCCLGWFFVTIS